MGPPLQRSDPAWNDHRCCESLVHIVRPKYPSRSRPITLPLPPLLQSRRNHLRAWMCVPSASSNLVRLDFDRAATRLRVQTVPCA